MRYVFGPIASRRLGRSLGVDPIAYKACNWNCVYCQLGRTTPLQYERKEFVPADEVVAEVAEALAQRPAGSVDWITFGGSGEPTLHAGLGRMIRGVKAATDVPVAVLTNGALLYRPEVQADLMPADAVLPTLDAGSEELFQRINRPRPELTFGRLVDGLVAFRRVFGGRLWVEVMLIKGLNDDEAALSDIAAVLERIRPDEVHVNQPVRPPAEGWVEAPDGAALARAASIFGARARVVGATAPCLELSARGDVSEVIIEILARHPMSLEELVQALERWSPGEVAKSLAALSESGRVSPVARMGRQFWGSAAAKYSQGVPPGH
jgi:wyosine [tRNA(Phe)-imidazoG37] synthetase (radical SAM superfamily)